MAWTLKKVNCAQCGAIITAKTKLAKCDKCKKANAKAYEQNRKDRQNEYYREYYKDTDRRKKRNERVKDWHEKNKDRVRERSRKYFQETGKHLDSYKRRQRRKSRIRDYKTRGAKVVDNIVLSDLLRRDNWKCKLCGKSVQKKNIYADDAAEIDHIIPLSKGGEHSYDNTQILCRKCNREKGDSIIDITNKKALLKMQLKIFNIL